LTGQVDFARMHESEIGHDIAVLRESNRILQSAFQAKKLRKEEAVAERTEEQKDKDADESFMKVLQEKCEGTAKEWDERSVTRASELTAIAKALEALETGVVPNWGANKKLVGLQKKQTVKVRSVPSSFLQLRGSALLKEERLRDRILQALTDPTHHSPMLTALSLKVKVAEDHFVKVRSIIKDLLEKLAAQAAAEKTQKGFCDEQMKATISTRDEKAAEVLAGNLPHVFRIHLVS